MASVKSGSVTYFAGSFTTINGVSANRIAKYNGTYSALGTGTNGTIRNMVMIGSDLYVAGSFTEAGGVPANGLAKWDGSTWSAVAVEPEWSLGYLYDLAVYNSELYVATAPTTVNGFPASSLIRYQPTGALEQGSFAGISLSSDPSTGDVFLQYSSPTEMKLRTLSGSTWSAPTSWSAEQLTCPSFSYDDVSGEKLLYWIENALVRRLHYSGGSWDSGSNLTPAGTKTSCLASDEKKAGGVVKVLLNDVTSATAKLFGRADSP